MVSADTERTEPHRAYGVEPETRSRARTTEVLLRAARMAFAERGVEATTVVDICTRAGFTRGAFYSNFSSKEAILTSMVERIASEQIESVRANLAALHSSSASANSWESLLSELLDRARVDEETLVLIVELQLHALRSPRFRAEYASLFGRLEDELTESVKRFATFHSLGLRFSAHQSARALMSVWLSSATLAATGVTHSAPPSASEDVGVYPLAAALFVANAPRSRSEHPTAHG